MIIQTILLDPSGAVWTDEALNVSRLNPSRAVQIDAEHPTRNRKGSSMVGRQALAALPVAPRGWEVILKSLPSRAVADLIEVSATPIAAA
jgi:hypothetical protein